MAESGCGRPLASVLRCAADRLKAAGIESATHDAQALAAHVLGVRRGDLVLVDRLTPPQARGYAELVDRRAQRTPLQHLLGRAGFRHLDLAIGPGGFVPRPETESVVQWAVDALREDCLDRPLLVDLCSGPGTIALALANEVPGARVHAVESDAGELAWAQRNLCERTAAGDTPVMLHLADIADALHELDGEVDVVVSNPPYVAAGELDMLDPEVRDHDPRVAVAAGPDGLEVIRLVANVARRLLRAGGRVAVEHSDRQGRTVPAVFAETDWADVTDHKDLAGRDRFVTGTRR